jgi:hypothetical protein
MFDRVKLRIKAANEAVSKIAAAAAPLVQERFRTDATTNRGNVPSFGRMGDVPIVAEARPHMIAVSGPAWCVEKARQRGQTKEWRNIVQGEARRIMRGAR